MSSPICGGPYPHGVADEAGPDDGSVPGAVEGAAGEPGDVDRGATERLMFFSDAVVAIAITLLAIELPVPESTTTSELLAALAEDSLAYLTFVISFLVVGAHWRAHHRVFRYLGRVDRTFVHLNFAWLLIIIVTPFLTEIIREGELDVARFGMYALAQALLLLRVRSHAGDRPAPRAVRARHTGGDPRRQLGAPAPGRRRVPRVHPAVPGAGVVGLRAVGSGAEPAAPRGRGRAAEAALSRRVSGAQFPRARCWALA